MVRKIRIIRRAVVSVASVLLIAASPLTAVADDSTGPTSPPGPDAKTYTYNAGTGMWENAYYIWNPATGQTTPKTTQTYSYNPATGRWDTVDWIYDAAQGKYVPNTVSVVSPPAGAITTGGPDSAVSTDGTAAASTQGPDSPVSDSGGSTGLYDNFYNASISNTLNQSASTGNATVSLNTTGGSALSGNATDMVNVLNLLMSSATPLQNNLATFTQNIYGDVQGDIMIDPSQIPSASSLSQSSRPDNLTINTQANGQINNDINLDASTGDATVSQNTTAGDAKTGNADAVANIMNVINSVIGTGSAFMGTVNIYGNLDGDILMPPDTLSALLASGAAPTVTTQGPSSPINGGSDNTLSAKLNQDSSINNTVNLTAGTGTAAVTNNTSAGIAATGNASTNLTVLNLTGQQVIGKDALLVFVNVLGKWVGMIVNAPSGSTSAALGDGISTAGPNSSVSTSSDTNTNLNYNATNSINNNVTASSKSGNALVSSNTTAGNATSGNATASVNLLNISASSLNLSNWLGILFINVFGSWNGSFGIDTAAGNKPVASGSSNNNQVASAVKSVKVFSFVPKGGANSYSLSPVASADNPSSGTANQSTVLSAINTTPKSPLTSPTSKGNLLWTAGSLFLLAGILTTEEAYARRKEARAKFRRYVHSVTVQPFKRS
jgi:hypothetical protein